MRLGKDALVLTQTSNSRSIAFLSQSLNEGKDVYYQDQGFLIRYIFFIITFCNGEKLGYTMFIAYLFLLHGLLVL